MTWPAQTNIFWHILLTSHPPKVETSQKPKSWLVSDLLHPAGARSHSTSIYFDFVGGMAGPTSKQHISTPCLTPVPLCTTWATMPVPWCNERRCTLIPDVAERGLRVRQLWDLCIFLTSWLCLGQFFWCGFYPWVVSGDSFWWHQDSRCSTTSHLHCKMDDEHALSFQQALSSKIHATWTSHFKSIHGQAGQARGNPFLVSDLQSPSGRRRLCKTKSLRRAGYVARQEKQPG